MNVLPVEELVSNTSSTSNRESQITVLKDAMRSTVAPLRNFSETGFEVSLKAKKYGRCLPELASYF